MRKFELREAVVTPNTSIGRVSSITIIHGKQAMITVQFGADGPFFDYTPELLRWATPEEIEDAIPGTG